MGLGILGKKVATAINAFIATLTDTQKKEGWSDSGQREDLQKAIFNQVEDFIVPIGGIISWHKNLSGVPALKDNWVECNGQTISDSESPLDGVTLEDLNGDKRFLRGNSTSGTLETPAMWGHRHKQGGVRYNPGGIYSYVPWGSYNPGTPPREISTGTAEENEVLAITSDPQSDGSNGTPSLTNEPRPINMNVVWIIRIK